MNKIELKKWFGYQRFEIVPNGLKVTVKTVQSFQELVVKFEDLGFEEQILKFQPSYLITILYFSLIFNIAFIFISYLMNWPTLGQPCFLPLGQ